MKCVIIDDEPLAVELLEDFVQKVDSLELIHTFNNAIDAISFINQNNVDLIFLDIQMPHFSGIDFLNTIEKKPLVIFTTAFDEYAIKAFEVNAVDYLLKPIEKTRFDQAMQKLPAKLAKEEVANLKADNERIIREAKAERDAILKEAGLTPDRVAKTTCYLTSMDHFAAFNDIYSDYFAPHNHFPARSCIAVKELPKGALVEVEILGLV